MAKNSFVAEVTFNQAHERYGNSLKIWRTVMLIRELMPKLSPCIIPCNQSCEFIIFKFKHLHRHRTQRKFKKHKLLVCSYALG